jgi:hypothetical protein
MKCAIEIASDGMMYIPSFMKIGSGIQAILRLLPRQSERLQYWKYQWEGLMMHTAEMTSDGMTRTH